MVVFGRVVVVLKKPSGVASASGKGNHNHLKEYYIRRQMEDIFCGLIRLNAYLCPEPGGHWSVNSIDGDGNPYFSGWGETPEDALEKANEDYIKWCAR